MRRQTVNNSKEKAATLGVGAQGSGNLVKKPGSSSNAVFRTKTSSLASLRLKGLFNDEGYFYGWEVAQ